MKKIFIALAIAALSIVATLRVEAYEGNAEFSNDQVSCRASSMWKEDHYEVIGKCDGLVYPYQTKLEHYYAWAHEVERDGYVRIGEVDRGYFEGDVGGDFDRVMITAEEASNPRRASDVEVLTGNLNRYEFARSESASEEVVEETVEESPRSSGESETVQVDGEDESSVGSVVGRILITILAIVVVVIVVVIVGSLIFRRRGSVSG